MFWAYEAVLVNRCMFSLRYHENHSNIREQVAREKLVGVVPHPK